MKYKFTALFDDLDKKLDRHYIPRHFCEPDKRSHTLVGHIWFSPIYNITKQLRGILRSINRSWNGVMRHNQNHSLEPNHLIT
jgi:hypothetical protein